MKKRILVCSFHQESNTFNTIVWDIDRFGTNREFEGAARLEKSLNGKTAVHGGYTAITETGGEVIPTVFLHAGSGGRVADDVLNYLCERMAHYIKTEEFDGIYAALHGATCTENEDDACGFFLEILRKMVGDKPIAASFDLHAKITDKVLKNADIVCGYQTYPHIDFFETGYRAAKHLMGLLEGKNAVCYPGMEDRLIGARVPEEVPVVRDGTIITSRGAGTAFDFGLELVAVLTDEETAQRVKASVCCR